MTSVTLADLGRIYDGPHATPKRRSEGPYFLNISSLSHGRLDLSQSDHVDDDDFATWTRRVEPQVEDLLFSYETRLGEAALMPEGIRACLGRRMALLRPDTSKVDPRFLLYYYLSPEFQRTIHSRSIHGATVSRIPLNTMGGWPVVVPSMRCQQAIAAVLGALDDKIAANLAIMQVEGELLQALFAESIAHHHSQVYPFLEAVDVKFGEPFKGSEFCPAGIGRPLIRIRDLRTNRCQVWTKEFRPKEELVRPGDLLAGMDAEFRPSSWTGEQGLLNQRVCKLSSQRWGDALLREIVRAPLLEIERAKSATTVIHLNKSDLVRCEVIAPSPFDLDKLNATMQPIYDHSVSLAVENRTIAELRDTLLPALMSGRLRVKDAERQVEDAI